MDALITATAVQAGLTVLTRDTRLARLLGGEARFEIYGS
jgi:predicted nucleic acid-binding protein